jgi:hypothetical protein
MNRFPLYLDLIVLIMILHLLTPANTFKYLINSMCIYYPEGPRSIKDEMRSLK